MEIFGGSDIGKIRKTNQDKYAYGKPMQNAYYAIVCDGMGGTNGGGIASQIALDRLKNQFDKNLREDMNEQSIKHLFDTSFSSANEQINKKTLEDKTLKGMGTTVVATIFIRDQFYIGYIGDSRAYLYSKGIITQLTKDHSFVQMLLQRGEIDEEEAKHHPRRNEITKALGILSDVKPDFIVGKVNSQDKIMLCTDGLTNVCTDEDISAILRKNSLNDAVEKLIGLANDKGGSDNITVIVADNK